jgi:hypothetical protein
MRGKLFLPLGAGILVFFAATYLWLHGPSNQSSPPSAPQKTASPNISALPPSVPFKAEPPQPADKSDTIIITRKINALLQEIRQGASPPRVLELLAELKKLLHHADPDEAAAALVAFLETGADSPTKLGFKIGPEGIMEETPTLRTALLDLLGQTDPTQSADYARVIMGTTRSADEYALAMRNLAWSSPGDTLQAELKNAFLGMLGRSEWRMNPTTGFLEAFDLAVATGALQEVAPLLQNQPVGVAEPPISRAAFVALDRMMLRNPDMVVATFVRDPSFLAQAPFHRASIMTRLDPRQPSQKDLLAQYLLRPDHASGELDYFAGVFPNGNRFSSHRLTTGWEAGGGIAEQDAIDQAVLQTLEEWAIDPKFAATSDTLQKIHDKLAEFSQY